MTTNSHNDTTTTVPLPHTASLPSIDELIANQFQMKNDESPSKNNHHGRHIRVATEDNIMAAVGRYNNNTNNIIALKRRTSFPRVTTTSCSSSLPSRTANNSSSPTTARRRMTSTQLLQNMMRSHQNRNPYKDYLVLGMIGKGSIGSVEKVVRKHHSVIMSQGNVLEKDQQLLMDQGGFCAAGGIFNYCYRWEKPRGQVEVANPTCWWPFSKLFNNNQSQVTNNDVFQSTVPIPQSATIDNNFNQQQNGSISIVSESSAFSAPTSPTMPHYEQRQKNIPSLNNYSEIRSSSQHGTILNDHHHGYHYNNAHQHPLRRYALKSIRLDRTNNSTGISSGDEAELRNEISILRSLDHPHIVHIIEMYEYKNMIYMVIDLCENGDLYVYDPYSEGEAKGIMRQLLQAMSYMHHRGIVHRDLKYENVMFTDRDRSKLEIKLIDFGLSMKYGKSKGEWDMSIAMTDFVGTIYTMAPEVIHGSYTYKCDLWSLGVMAYMLLSSQIPFCGDDAKSITRKIMWGTYSFSGIRWSKISKQGRDFVSSLLIRDASSRPTADQALKHRWLDGGKPSFNSKSLHRRHSSETVGGTVLGSLKIPHRKPLDSQICSSIENYSNYSWMHRLALMVIAYRYTGKETTHLRRIFTSYDVDDSGTVDAEELRNAFVLHGKYNQEEIDQIFLAVDMNGSGKISWTEFLASTIETKGHISEAEFSSAFEHLDFDKNGYISTSDLREIIGRDLPQNIIDQIIDESDIIGDHKIWRYEFLALGEESTAVSNVDHQRRQVRVYLKRSKSADDFDLVKTRSLDKMHSNPDVSNQFGIEKAKSVRKATQFA